MEPIIQPAVVREGFTLAVDHQKSIYLRLSGNADMEMVPVLGPYVQRLHNEILRVGAREVMVDLRELYFMNSSCFKALLMWIASIKKLIPDDAYNVQFLTNPKQTWQKRNLRAMQEFAPSIVDVVDA